MNAPRRRTALVLAGLAAGFILLILPAISGVFNAGQPATVLAQQSCFPLDDPQSIPAPILINFDNLSDAAVIGNSYLATFGVSFEDNPTNQAIIYGQPSAQAHSDPNVAINNAVFPNTSVGVPMVIDFDSPKTHVGFYMGNGDTPGTVALVTAYDIQGAIVCQVRQVPVDSAHTNFFGFYDTSGSIRKITLDYGDTSLSESIDDLYFSPARGELPPPRRPEPTWTPVPPLPPTPGPTPTPTPIVPMYPFLAPVEQIYAPVFLKPDLSIHGIEITQGIQCFDSTKGLAGCGDNSLRVVNKKDSAARIYLKTGGIYASLNNIPVRLYIRANNIWYSGNASGKATTAINQAVSDSANIYFNVNFTNDVVVDFYAVVDPNNTISESDEGNNRYPASGYITLTFRTRETLKIVGQRLRYHPSGYSSSEYAGGWAVNGGAADWFEQLLPLRNNGINYALASGYKNWTTSLGSGDGQHDLIKSLNGQWILENVFFFWFSGAFTGADHVYGWAPNDGYSGGHADMPVYPHAGGYGVVGIGTDRPGTSTDDPGGGALIFGHELIHDYDILHTNTGDSCGSSDSASDFPYSSSSIQEFGFNPITGKIYNPSNTHDVMSYCPAGGSKLGWMAPFTWEKMNTELDAASQIQKLSSRSAQVNTLQPSVANESLIVNLTVFNPQYAPPVAGSLNELYKVSTGVNFTPQLGGYAVELRDGKGSLIASQPFAVNFESEYDAHAGENPLDDPPFPPEPTTKIDLSFVIPWVDGTASVALVNQGATIDQVTVSQNAPQVIISKPDAAEDWLPGSQHTIIWQGLDLDGDPLVYALFYSKDGGLSWELLDDGLTDQQATLDTDDLAGGSDVRFRVVATDGILTGVDETDQTITVPNHAPELTILNPVDGGRYLQDSLVVLQGMAIDFEDGTLDDGLLSWSSDVQGALGVGPSVPLNTLLTGNHTITLTATDSYGISNSTQVTIFVGYPLYLPQVGK